MTNQEQDTVSTTSKTLYKNIEVQNCTYSFDLQSLSLEFGLLNSSLSLNTGSLSTGLSLCFRLPCALHGSAVCLQLQEILTCSLGLRLISDLLTFKASLSLLFKTFSLVPDDINEMNIGTV